MGIGAGTRIGEYEILSLLGAGGMGEVYRAHDLRLRREIAIKVLPAFVCSDPDRLRRFEQEATAAAALNHPNILAVYQLGTFGSAPYLVSELLEGETLREQIRRGRIPVRKAIDYGMQIARGLAAAHEKGIVHRDLKPENLFVTKDGRIKILDFGLAKLIQPQSDMGNASPTIASATEMGQVMGTVGYMAPEQVRGEVVDHRADIFAFGAVLYELLTGVRAFQKATGAETMTAILREEPVAISQTATNVPMALQRVVQRCLEKSPKQRFHSASDLAFALEALTDSGAIAHERGVSSAERKSSRWLIIAGAAVVVAAIAAGWWILRPHPESIHSVAVLPFSASHVNSAGDDLSDGVTESLIDSLSQLQGLRVMSRASSFRFRQKDLDPQQAGQTLKVDAVLTGQVSQQNGEIQVSAELVKTDDGSHLWGKHYASPSSDILALQQQIAGDVSIRLQPGLNDTQRARVNRAPTQNAAAYQLYVKGSFFYDRWSEEGRQKALDYFQRAIENDPGFAAAYAGLADTYSLRGFFAEASPDEIAQGTAAARKAIALDDSLAEAHAALGLALLIDLQWADSERELRRSITLNPNCSLCRTNYAWFLVFSGDTPSGLKEAEQAKVLDPLSFMASYTTAEANYFGRHYGDALHQIDQLIEAEPTSATLLNAKGDINLAANKCSEAFKAYAHADELTGESKNAAALTKAFDAVGCHGALEQQLKFYSDPANQDYFSMSAAIVAAFLGDKDKAFKFLELAYQSKQGTIWLKSEPLLDNIRSDPRYAEWLRRIGLKDDQPASLK